MIDIEVTLRRLLEVLKKDESLGSVESAKKAKDPDVNDRLLIGFAKLVNSVESRIDGIEDDLFYLVLRRHLPGIMDPMPAMTAMLLDVDADQQVTAATVNLGSVVLSRNANKVMFLKTMRNVRVYPMRVETKPVKLRDHEKIECRFSLSELADINQFSMKALSLLIDAPYPSACVWYERLLNNVVDVCVVWHVDGKENKISLPVNIKPTRIFYRNNNNLEEELKDLYYHISCPARSLAVDVFGLGDIQWPKGLSSWSLMFTFSNIKTKSSELVSPKFAINWVPVKCVKSVCADPIILQKNQVVYPLSIDGLPEECALCSLDLVYSTSLHSSKKTYYQKSSGLLVDESTPTFSFINNTLYPTKQGSVFLQTSQDDAVLSIEASVAPLGGEDDLTNISSWVLEGHPHVSPKVFSVVSLAKPVLMDDKAVKKDNLLSLGFFSLLEKDALLSLFFSIKCRDGVFYQYIMSISDIFYNTGREFINNALFDVIEISITIQPEYFNGSAEAYFFACFLHQFYSVFSPINTFVRLKVKYNESPFMINWVVENSFLGGF